MNLIDKSSNISNIFGDNSIIGFKYVAIMFILGGLLGSYGFYSGFELYVFGFIAALLVVFFLFKYPKLWIYSVVLLQITFVRESSKGLTASEVLTAIIFSLGLVVWFINKLLIKREKIVEDMGDWIILFFMLVLVLNLFVAISNDVEPIDWFREYNLFSYILYYFPIRDILKDKDDLKKFLTFSIAVLFVMELVHFVDYYLRLQENVVYAYQLGVSMRRSQTMFVTAGTFLLTFTFYQNTRYKKLLMLFMTAVTIVALLSTFSRTFWVYYIIAVAIIFLYIPMRKKANLIVYAVVISLFIYIGFYFAAKENVMIMAKVYLERLTSSTKGAKDISMQARFKEWEAVQKVIETYPIGGTGLKSTFKFYDMLLQYSTVVDIVHNGYLWTAYRIGIPLTFIFYMFFVIKLFRSIVIFVNVKDKYFKLLMLCTAISLASILLTNFISHQVIARDCLFTIAFLLSFVSMADRQHKAEIRNQLNPVIQGN